MTECREIRWSRWLGVKEIQRQIATLIGDGILQNSMAETLTAVLTDMDWEGLYIGDELAYQNHNVELHNVADALADYDGNIDDAERLPVKMNQLGRGGHLPTSLSTLRDMREFRDEVTDDVDEWENHLRETISSFDDPPTHSEFMNALELESHEFRVVETLFMPRSISIDQTPLSREAIISVVDGSTAENTRFTLASNENARINNRRFN